MILEERRKEPNLTVVDQPLHGLLSSMCIILDMEFNTEYIKTSLVCMT